MKEEPLDIIISNGSDKPIYQQIEDQIKEAILEGVLKAGDPLPSIRMLANDLRVSVITTKRAYAELEDAGFINTVQGKGSFVSGFDPGLLREECLLKIEGLLAQAVDEARKAGVDADELSEMLRLLIED